MTLARLTMGLGLGAIVAAGFVASPALRAQGADGGIVAKRAPFARIGAFTPASGDPKLAAILARSNVAPSGFRFTPSAGQASGTRAVTVAVRARDSRTSQVAERAASPTMPALAPIAYNLGTSVGWKRFAVTGELGRLDVSQPRGSREPSVDLSTYNMRKPAARAVATDSSVGAGRMNVDAISQPVDLKSSYSLTRNLDVMAGVRSRTDRDRMIRMAPDRRDSQAVYVGTAFRF